MKQTGIILGAMLALVPWASSSQELTDAQKRRVHLPYVRAATDCFARQVGANMAAIDMARQGRWYDALATVGKACDPQVIAMISEHDRLYGPGTGAPFFKGPYVEDLPRAVSTRLKDVLARRSAEVEQVEAARKQRHEEANRTRDLLRDRMYACTTKEVLGLVASSETAEVLATAAMTICNKEVQATLDAAEIVYQLDGGTGNGLRDELRSVIQRNVVTAAVKARAAAKQAGQAPDVESSTVTRPPPVRTTTMQTPEECLKDASSLREGKLVEQEKLISTMLEICRPEIENAARDEYLNDPTQQLSELRTKSLERAIAYAKRLVNAQ